MRESLFQEISQDAERAFAKAASIIRRKTESEEISQEAAAILAAAILARYGMIEISESVETR